MWSSAPFANKIAHQDLRGEVRSVLLTDFDHTLWRPGLEAALVQLTREAEELGYPIVVVTGREFDDLLNQLHAHRLPQPDAAITDGGTRIFVRELAAHYSEDLRFAKLVNEKFNRNEVYRKLEAIVAEFRKDPAMKHFNLEFQTKELQGGVRGAKRVCMLFSSTREQMHVVPNELERRFPEHRMIWGFEIHYAKDHPNDPVQKYVLDITAVEKIDAAKYFCDKFGIKQGLVAGDAGNDIKLLLEMPQGFAGVLVGGYKHEAELAIDAVTVSGRRGFRRVRGEDGHLKPLFVEYHQTAQAAESIRRAARILLRALRKRRVK